MQINYGKKPVKESHWTYAKWAKAGEKSKSFDSFKLYIIRCWNEDESFYKIGKTFLKVGSRFKNLPYEHEVICTISNSSSFISKLEKKLQRENKSNKYLPKIKFTGQSECFKNLNCSEGLSYLISSKLTQYGKKNILRNCVPVKK